MKRFVACLLVVASCGPELLITSGTATSEQSSGDSNNSSEEDRDTWLVITAILVASSVVALVSALSGDEMWAYMEHHQRDVRRALASGEGPFPSDLTDSLGLPLSEVPRVARILREGRGWLGPLVDEGPIDLARTKEFWGQLLVLLEADPVTGPRVQTLRVRAHAIEQARAGS